MAREESIYEQEPEFESLMNDALFHMVFANNETALRGLLSCLLNIPESEMAEIMVLNPMQYTDAITSKLTVLDLKLHLADGKYINIEVQVRRFTEWTNRTLVYACRSLVDQTNAEGFAYDHLEPVIQISIMNHTLFEDHRRFFAKYALRDDENYLYSNKLQFYVMDLKAINEANDEDRQQGLVEWAEAFSADNWEQVQRIENPAIKEAVKQMRTIMNTPEQRQIIWDRKMAEMDARTQYNSARNEGKQEGLAVGEKRGMVKTLASFVKDGMISIADAAQRANMTVTEFAQAAGLPIS